MNSTARLTPARRILITAVALAISTAGVASAQQTPPLATVRTAIAEKQLMAPRIELPGTVISRNDARIASEIPGRVDWVAEVGTKLETGDVIARIDDRMPQLQLRENDVIIKRLEANLNYQKRDVERVRELAATNNTPISRLDESVSRRDMTEQDLAQAQIARERTVYLLEHTKVRAPFSGRIVERLLKPGEYSVAGTEVVRLVDVTNVEVRTQVPVALAAFVADGMSVAVTGNGVVKDSPIRAVIPIADEHTRTFEVRVSIPADIWVIGGAVKVALPSGAPREVVAVPRDALILRSNSTYVFKINSDEVAERANVRTGAASGKFIEVLGAVKAGDKVVVRGGERLKEGQKVSAEAIS